MTAILFPVLLIVVALAVILALFGRHLPDIARGMKEKKNEESAEPINELPVSPKNFGLTKPLSSSWAEKIGKLKPIFSLIVGKVVFVSKKTVPIAAFVVKKILSTFHRVPRIRPSIGVFRKQTDDQNSSNDFENKDMSERSFSTLTTDIKIMPKNQLRYPEPIPEEKTKTEKKSEVKKQPVLEIEDSIDVSTDISEKTDNENDPYAEKLVSEPKISLEKTREIRTKIRRRFSGKVTVKPAVSAMPREEKKEDSSVKHNLNDSVSAPVVVEEQPSVSLEAKKVSFIDKEGVALGDSTQEIGKMIQEGNYGRAESDLIDVLSKNPRNTEAYRLLGIVYLKRKDFTQAREVFEEALRRDPEHGGLQGPLGFCYMSMGEYGKALSMYQQALNMDEENIEYLEQLLVISARMDRRPLVKMVAKKILAINPHHVEAKKYLERIAA